MLQATLEEALTARALRAEAAYSHQLQVRLCLLATSTSGMTEVMLVLLCLALSMIASQQACDTQVLYRALQGKGPAPQGSTGS